MLIFIVIFVICTIFWLIFGNTILYDWEIFNNGIKSILSSTIGGVICSLLIYLLLSAAVYFSCGIKYEFLDAKPIIKMTLECNGEKDSFYMWKDPDYTSIYIMYKNGKQSIKTSVNDTDIDYTPG